MQSLVPKPGVTDIGRRLHQLQRNVVSKTRNRAGCSRRGGVICLLLRRDTPPLEQFPVGSHQPRHVMTGLVPAIHA